MCKFMKWNKMTIGRDSLLFIVHKMHSIKSRIRFKITRLLCMAVAITWTQQSFATVSAWSHCFLSLSWSDTTLVILGWFFCATLEQTVAGQWVVLAVLHMSWFGSLNLPFKRIRTMEQQSYSATYWSLPYVHFQMQRQESPKKKRNPPRK
jgi:hypothetical protein